MPGLPVHLAWGEADAAALLAELVGEPVRIIHLCPACGSDRHGRPRVVVGASTSVAPHSVSIARDRGFTLVGIATEGLLGVDVEASGAVVDLHVRHPDDAGADAALWVRKEAYLKASGEGLRRDPRTVSPREAGARWGALDVGPDRVAAWCLLERPG